MIAKEMLAIVASNHLKNRSGTCRSVAWISALVLAACTLTSEASDSYQVKPVTEEQALEYGLDMSYYKKCTMVQQILIAT